MQKKLPIGVFDSGVGGLTVLSALKHDLPNESFIYLGDTARLPYGTKSAETVVSYASTAAGILVQKGVKLIVVACNTASSVAIDYLQDQYPEIPVVGVVEPAVRACTEILGSSARVGVIATESTIKWHTYKKAFQKVSLQYEILEWPCSLMVALAEQGWTQGPLTEEILRTLLYPFIETEKNLPALILGCTHFPVFKESLLKILPDCTFIIDSAQWVSRAVVDILCQNKLFNETESKQTIEFLVTDNPERFTHLAPIFLNQALSDIEVQWIHMTAPLKAMKDNLVA